MTGSATMAAAISARYGQGVAKCRLLSVELVKNMSAPRPAKTMAKTTLKLTRKPRTDITSTE